MGPFLGQWEFWAPEKYSLCPFIGTVCCIFFRVKQNCSRNLQDVLKQLHKTGIGLAEISFNGNCIVYIYLYEDPVYE